MRGSIAEAGGRPRRRTTIQSARLRLSPPESGDYGAWRALRLGSEDHLRPWEPVWAADATLPSGWRRAMDMWKEAWRSGRSYAFLIWRLGDNALLGGVTLSNVRYGNAMTASIGYWLGAAHTGQGYMAESVASICRWAFLEVGLERIEAAALPANDASRKVLTATGFEEEGFARDYLQIAGKREDHVLYGLSKRAWRRHQDA
ncbi:MAG: GNAT family protein [Pseudomonadota bacterium]